jgi:hypothetical protein
MQVSLVEKANRNHFTKNDKVLTVGGPETKRRMEADSSL